jgi:hypothetical protein
MRSTPYVKYNFADRIGNPIPPQNRNLFEQIQTIPIYRDNDDKTNCFGDARHHAHLVVSICRE